MKTKSDMLRWLDSNRMLAYFEMRIGCDAEDFASKSTDYKFVAAVRHFLRRISEESYFDKTYSEAFETWLFDGSEFPMCRGCCHFNIEHGHRICDCTTGKHQRLKNEKGSCRWRSGQGS